MKYVIFIFLYLLCDFTVQAQQNNKRWLHLFREDQPQNFQKSGYVFIKFKDPWSPVTLAETGIQVMRQLSETEYVIKYPSGRHPESEYLVTANMNWKLSPFLMAAIEDLHEHSRFTRKFLLYGPDALSLRKSLVQLNDPMVKIEYSSPSVTVISTTIEKLLSVILPLETVVFVESMERTATEEKALNRLDLITNKVNLVHSEFPLLNGNGLTVSVKEQKPDTTDIDLSGRYISSPFASTSTSSHATIMTTIIAGAGNSYYTGKGVAWGSLFTSSSFAKLLPDPDSTYQKFNITVQNHSYGTGIENYYGADAMAYDQSTINNPLLLHVFSSGNSGLLNSTTGSYAGLAGYANLTGSFKMSKNSITVGAIDSLKSIAPLSSRGPSFDGRVKPELVAIGEDGSSGAAAIVSGISLLCQQAYQSKHNGLLPEASLVKAILINSADDMAEKGVDYRSGYGSANAYRAINTIYDGRYLSGEITGNQSQNFALLIPANAKNLKVTIAWTDPAANPNAYRSLVNDLDMELLDKTTKVTWKPWVLNPFPHPDSLMRLPQRHKDSLNNVEQITIEQPGIIYEILVNGYNLKSSQRFHIAYQWDEADYFKWTYPASNDNLIPGAEVLVRWETALTGNGELEYSGDGGKSWKNLARSIDIAEKQFRLQVPDSFHIGMMRIISNGKSYSTNKFTVSTPLILSVGFNCSDSTQWIWNPINNKKYILYQLGQRYLEPIGIYQDTSAIIKKSLYPSPYFAVAPLLDTNRTGMKSYALHYATQGVGCYLVNFFADKEQQRSLLHFSFSSLYNVARIELEKAKGLVYERIRDIKAGDQLYFTVVDSMLTAGINSYRLKITFTDARVIYSDPAFVYHFLNDQYILYPNPVANNEYLNVLTSDPEGVIIRVYNIYGTQLMQQKLTDSPQKFRVPFQRGIYIVELIKEGKRVSVRKLIVN